MTDLLVVDDNVRDHDRYRAFLADTGLDVLCCSTIAEAMRLTRGGGSFRVAVLLWELAGCPDLLAGLSRDQPELPLIVVSGLLDQSRAARARALGARDFLLKPLEKERLLEAIEAVLRTCQQPALFNDLHARVIGSSRCFLEMLGHLAQAIAQPEETVLLLGENGTGKEVLARAIHELGAADRERWTPINVAGIPASLMESTLFGHEAGAFTGARARHQGVFEESGAGTLFLDEIGELDLQLQAKLLRVIQERRFRPVGGNHDLDFKARLVCATNRDLIAEQAAGRFRRDLYFRISGKEIRIPPLRQRGGDLEMLVDHFLAKYAGGRRIRLTREAGVLLRSYPFPGNVRELDSLIKHAVHQCPGNSIHPYHLPVAVMEQRKTSDEAGQTPESIAWPESLHKLRQKDAVAEIENQFDREYLPRLLKQANGNVTRAAKAAGLDPKTFRKKWELAGLGSLSNLE